MTEPVELESLATEQRNPASDEMDLLDTVALVTLMNREDQLVALAIEPELPRIAAAVDVIAERLRDGGRLIHIGAGTSGRLGVLDASECPPTFNTLPGQVIGLIAGGDHALRHSIEAVEDDPDAGAKALKTIDLRARDVVVGIAASGRTPFVLGAITYAKGVGAFTIGVCNTARSRLAALVDIPIAPLPGAEILTGSTRLKAGTAQKMVLNMLSTGAMIRIGKTYGNLMVDVQPTNAKLKARAIAIVRDAAGVDEERARNALDDADGEVKTAIVALVLGTSVEEARERVTSARGVVRAALDGPAQ
jgi:N-acetylmuramic acid 6-phosphate etherase